MASKTSVVPGVRRAAGLMAGTALGCSLGMGAMLALPSIALAAGECGAPSGGVVNCPAGVYPNGVTYGATSGLVVNIADGSTLQNPGGTNTGAVLVSQGAGGSGALSVNAGGTTATATGGSKAFGVAVVNNGVGAVTVVAGHDSATGQFSPATAVTAMQGAASVTVIDSAASGLGSAGVAAFGRDGVSVVSTGLVSSQGASTNPDGTPNVVGSIRADGIVANSSTGAVNVTANNVSASGAGANGIFTLSGGNGATTINVGGAVNSAQAFGLALLSNGSGAMTVNVGAGASVTGGVSGINTEGAGAVTITNLGTIRNTLADTNDADDIDGAAINIAYDNVPAGTTINNLGTIIGTDSAGKHDGVAIWFDSGDDTLNLSTGTNISGLILGADGRDTINLNGSVNTKTASQTFGRVHEFEDLNVQTGYWTLNSEAYVDRLNIASGATLEVYEPANNPRSDDGGLGAGDSGALAAVVNGRLFLNQEAVDALVATANSKDGKVHVWGDGKGFNASGAGVIDIQIPGAAVFGGALTNAGGVNFKSGQGYLTGSVSGPVTVASGASLTIGATLTHDTTDVDSDGSAPLYVVSGPGANGVVTGTLTDNGVVNFNRTDNVSYSGLTGSGSANQTGGGNLTLTNYSLTGVTTLSKGTLNIAGATNATVKTAVAAGTYNASGVNVVRAAAFGTGVVQTDVAAGAALTTSLPYAINSTSQAGSNTVNNLGSVRGIAATSGNAGGAIVINSNVATNSGDGTVAILGAGFGDVTITAASTTATGNSLDGSKSASPEGASRADAIYASSGVGAVTVHTGDVTATGVGASGVRAMTTAGNVLVDVSGNVTSNAYPGVFGYSSNGGSVTMNVAAGKTLTGSVGAHLASKTSVTVDNAGTIKGSVLAVDIGDNEATIAAGGLNSPIADPFASQLTNQAGGLIQGVDGAVRITGEGGVIRVVNRGTIQSTGTTLNERSSAAVDIGGLTGGAGSIVDNYGSILGGLAGKKDGEGNPLIGTAISFDRDDDSDLADTLNLYTGSNIVGSVGMFGGVDTVNLNGTATSKTTTQRFGDIHGSEIVNVNSGYWTMGRQTDADTVNIAAGATLEMYENATAGTDGYFTPQSGDLAVVNNGTLVANSDDTHFYADASHLKVSGTGTLNLAAGALQVASAWSQGAVNVQGGTLLVTSDLTANVNIAKGAVVELGATLSAPNSDGAVTFTKAGTTGTINGNIVDDGTFIYNRSNDYTFNGSFGGTGSVVMRGGGTLTLNGVYTYSGGTTVESGLLKITQLSSGGGLNTGTGSVVDLSGGKQTAGGLSGGGTVNIDKGSLTINGGSWSSSTFSGNLTGAGELALTGGGTLDLTGTNTYTGPTTIGGGSTLKVNGSVNSDVTVGSGGALGGSGTINGDVTVGNGGVYSPGNSPGVSHVVGDVTFATGSTYRFEVDRSATPMNDLIAITGGKAIINGGTLAVQPAGPASSYSRRSTYTAITADGGITGPGFTGVTSSAAFITPYVTYGSKAVDVVLVNNSISLATLGQTANQASTLAAVNAGAPGAVLYDALAPQADLTVASAADQLSGESFAATPTALIARSNLVQTALNARFKTSEGAAGWASVLGAQIRGKGSAGVASVTTDTQGLLLGVEGDAGEWRLGAAAGYVTGDIDSSARNARTKAKGATLGAYAGGSLGVLRASFVASWTKQSMDSRRAVGVGVGNVLTSSYDASIGEINAKLQLPAYAMGAASLAPYGQLGAVRVKTDGVQESGGAAALSVAGQTRTVTSAALGARLTSETSLQSGGIFAPYLDLAWRGLSGDTESLARNRFGGGPAFTVAGAELESGAAVSVGFDIFTDLMKVGLSYEGGFNGDWRSDAAKVTVGWKF